MSLRIFFQSGVQSGSGNAFSCQLFSLLSLSFYLQGIPFFVDWSWIRVVYVPMPRFGYAVSDRTIMYTTYSSHVRRHEILVCLVVDNSNHVVKVVSAGIFHSNVIVFLTEISEWFLASFFETVHIICPHHTFTHCFLHPLMVHSYLSFYHCGYKLVIFLILSFLYIY